ncbi:Pentatricopeptide repeat-containing protein [Quillaja saponaria]|uniref:Pentatricopeptide repeat-containing protein n=1 Tax=Quillaja saponaria TaxID=32244 RepID=A0AAD7KMY3_QUISA|nr:Pentatricopeptide repeat-containing protein [Quillaja saponaria]
MMKHSAVELATRISRALIFASNHSKPTRSWSPSLEQTLHGLGCRDVLNPLLVATVIDPFLLNHHLLAFGFFNWASQQPSFKHNSTTYQSILKSLSCSRQFNAINRLLKQVKSQKIDLDSSIYRSIIASQIIGKKSNNAFSIFNEVNSLVEEIGPDICNSLLAALSSDGYLDSAQKVFREMTLRGVPFSTLGFGVFIWRISRNVGLEEVLAIVDEVKGGNSDINGSTMVVLIVHGLCHASRVLEAFSVLDELRNRGWKPDFMAYRIVAEAFRSMGDMFNKEMVLKRKRKLGVAPRNNDYRELILSLVSERMIPEAKELGAIVVTWNFPIEDDVLNVLIGSLSATDPGSAIMFFNIMVGKERFPTLLTLSNLCRSLCKHGKIDELLEVFRVLNVRNYFKDLEGYNVMVSYLCKAGRVKDAYAILLEMKRKGLGPDVSSYNSLMEACCKEDLLRPARKLWDEMFSNGCYGNLKTYNILICKFSEVGQTEEAQRLFHHMLDKGLAPGATTYTYLLEGLCQVSKLESAFEIYDMSVKQDVILASAILNPFILSLCRTGHRLAASKLLCSLDYDIGHTESHVILLKCLADASELAVAIQHLKWVKETSPVTLQDISSELLAFTFFFFKSRINTTDSSISTRYI